MDNFNFFGGHGGGLEELLAGDSVCYFDDASVLVGDFAGGEGHCCNLLHRDLLLSCLPINPARFKHDASGDECAEFTSSLLITPVTPTKTDFLQGLVAGVQ